MPEVQAPRRTRMLRFAAGLGTLWGLLASCGQAMGRSGNVSLKDGRFIVSFMIWTAVFTAGLMSLWQWLEKRSHPEREKTRWTQLLFGKTWLMMVILLICWLPCYLSIYPGNFSYDSGIEYNQCAYGYNNAMPFLHSFLLVNVLLKSMAATGSATVGIAVLTICQMILLSGLFALILRHFYTAGADKALLMIMLGYYAAFPTIHLLATCPIRDVLFSALLTLCVFETAVAMKDREKFFSSERIIGAAFTVTLTVLARNNSNSNLAYVLLLIVCLLVFLWAGTRFRRKAVWFGLCLFSSYFVLATLLSLACQPQTTLPRSTSLSVMTQPITRAYLEAGNTWSEEELEKYEYYFATDGLLYAEGLGDISASKLKTTVDSDGSRMGFLKFWLQTGVKHPGSYLNAWLANTKPLWYPGAAIDGYNYEGSLYPTYKDYERSYFSFSDYLDAPAQFNVKLPAVHSFYAHIAHDISFEKIPVVSWFFSPAFYVWVLLCCLFFALYRKDGSTLPALGILMLYVVVSMLVPVILVRYFAALFFAFPLVVFITVKS